MVEVEIVQGRQIGSVEIADVQALMAANPLWSRWRLSRVLAQRWQWFAASGQLKDMAARTLLLKLGVDLACLLFGAAAWQCAPRDRWIGWSAEQRARGLPWIANNSRFLILPWVRVPHLATHVLAQIARRIDADWQGRYHHRIHLLETFVEAHRFRGTCYQAANWIHVGQTTGRTRQSRRQRDNQVHAPVKDIYLYPLSPDGRRALTP